MSGWSVTRIQGKEKYTPPPWDPSFCGLSPDPEVTERKQKLWCIPFSLGKQGKRVYTIGPERRVYTIEPQTRKREKGGSPLGVVETVVLENGGFDENWRNSDIAFYPQKEGI